MIWIDKHKKKLGIGIAILGLLSTFVFFFLFSLGRVLDTSVVKTFINQTIYSYTDLDIQYKEVNTVVFPLPGFSIRGVEIREKEKLILQAERLFVEWDAYRLIEGDFVLRSVSLNDVEVWIHRESDGRIGFLDAIDQKKIEEDTEEFRSELEEAPLLPSEWMALLPVGLDIQNLNLSYQDDVFHRKDEWKILNLTLNQSPSQKKVNLVLDSELNGGKLHISSNARFTQDNWDYKSILHDIEFRIQDIGLNHYKDFLEIFPNANFEDTKVHLGVQFTKQSSDEVYLKLDNTSLERLGSKSKNDMSNISIRGNLKYNPSQFLLTANELSVDVNESTDVNITVETVLDKDKRKFLVGLQSNRFYLKKIQSIVQVFNRVDKRKISSIKKNLGMNSDKTQVSKQPSKEIVKISHSDENESKKKIEISGIELKLNLHRMNLDGLFLNSILGTIVYKDDRVEIQDCKIHLYDGVARINGYYYPKKKNLNLSTRSRIENVNIEKLLSQITKQKLITGRLNADVDLKTTIGGNSNRILSSMKMQSHFKIRDGELLGYANFIKPVAEIGKWINFTSGNQGKSTSFKSIHGDIKLENQRLLLSDFFMNGVGISAKGKGYYSLRGDSVNMKFTASLSGHAGKVIKIPIVYKGILGKNFAYIDPIWLASVYAGTILFAGPAGTIVGGMTGSLASDTVDKTTDTVKESLNTAKDFLFGGSKDKKK